MTLDEKIAMAQRHVDRGRIIVDKQRAMAASLGTPFSADLLASFEQTQLLFESDLVDLVDRRKSA